MVGLNLVQFLNDSWVIDRKTAELAETVGSLLVSVHLDEISRCLWQEEKSSSRLAAAIV
jgi:hypothetical protein